MNNNIKINYPSSEKIYMSGEIYPELKVGMRRVNLTPTVTIENGEKRMEENAGIYIRHQRPIQRPQRGNKP